MTHKNLVSFQLGGCGARTRRASFISSSVDSSLVTGERLVIGAGLIEQLVRKVRKSEMVQLSRSVIVVILNWKGEDDTIKCIESTLVDPSVRGVVVVDNESTGMLRPKIDHRCSVLGEPFIELIELEQNRGFAGGMNVGIARGLEIGAEYVASINPDALADYGAFSKMCTALACHPEAGIVGPLIVDADGEIQSSGSYFNPRTLGGQDRRFVSKQLEVGPCVDFNFLTWACVVVRSSVFRHVGLLDEHFFMYWEDVEFSLRVSDAGYSLLLCSSARVCHALSASHSRAGSRISLYTGLGNGVLVRRQSPFFALSGTFRTLAKALKRALLLRFRDSSALLRGFGLGFRNSRVPGWSAWRYISEHPEML